MQEKKHLYFVKGIRDHLFERNPVGKLSFDKGSLIETGFGEEEKRIILINAEYYDQQYM